MSRPNPYCPICHGIGWHEAPYHSNFEPRLEIQPCPECNQVKGSATGCLLVTALVVGFIVLICWGMP